jgi:hypothetical protein
MTISELEEFQRKLRSGGFTETTIYGNNKMTMDPVITYWEYDKISELRGIQRKLRKKWWWVHWNCPFTETTR